MNSKITSIVTWVVLLGVVIGGFAWYGLTADSRASEKAIQEAQDRSDLTSTSTVLLDDFAKCVAEHGVVMYGAWWCPHCKNEKKRFGDSFQYINYVECTDNPQLCTDKQVESYPTWIFGDGSRLSGELGFAPLAEKTGCSLPTTIK
jgi:hypothetical protein